MKIYLKILPAFLALGCCMPMACKKAESQTEKIGVVTPPVISKPEAKLLPLQMGTGKSKMTFSYTSGHALSKIDYGDGTSSVLEFTATGSPSLLTHALGNEIVAYTQFKLDNSGRVIKGSSYTIAGNKDVFAGMFSVTYQSDSKISEISHYDSKQILLSTDKRIYADNGNLIMEQGVAGVVSANYSYDDKNGLFKNVGFAWLFAIEEQNMLFLSGLNNISSCGYPLKSLNNQSFSYTYNEDGYPESVKFPVNGVATSYKVSYKVL